MIDHRAGDFVHIMLARGFSLFAVEAGESVCEGEFEFLRLLRFEFEWWHQPWL